MFKPKYEYKVSTVNSGEIEAMKLLLRIFEDDGWQLVTYQDYYEESSGCVLFFKRKIPIWAHLKNFFNNIDWLNLENKINEFPNPHIHGK